MYRAMTEECAPLDGLRIFLRDISQTPLLSEQAERDLAEAIASGDQDARDRMVRANLRLVATIAKDYQGRGIMLDDLIGEGYLGLIRAAEDYDPRFGTRFSTYAGYWIKQAIRRALMNTTTTIRLPAHLYKLMSKWHRTERLLLGKWGRAPSFDEVAAHLCLTESQRGMVAKAQRASHLTLESSLGLEDASSWVDRADDTHADPHEDIQSREDCEGLAPRMCSLDERERTVLEYRYGLGGKSPLTVKEIGRRLGITREWVRAIQQRALAKLACRPHLDEGLSGRTQVSA